MSITHNTTRRNYTFISMSEKTWLTTKERLHVVFNKKSQFQRSRLWKSFRFRTNTGKRLLVRTYTHTRDSSSCCQSTAHQVHFVVGLNESFFFHLLHAVVKVCLEPRLERFHPNIIVVFTMLLALLKHFK